MPQDKPTRAQREAEAAEEGNARIAGQEMSKPHPQVTEKEDPMFRGKPMSYWRALERTGTKETPATKQPGDIIIDTRTGEGSMVLPPFNQRMDSLVRDQEEESKGAADRVPDARKKKPSGRIPQ